MNIYNTLYFLEYSREPIQYDKCKCWYLNLSKNRYWYCHRNFDLPAYIYKYKKRWYRFNYLYRLIGNSIIDIYTFINKYFTEYKHWK